MLLLFWTSGISADVDLSRAYPALAGTALYLKTLMQPVTVFAVDPATTCDTNLCYC